MANDVFNGDGGSSSWSLAADWQSGSLPNNGDNVEIAYPNSVDDMGSVQIDNLQIDGSNLLSIDGSFYQYNSSLEVTESITGGNIYVADTYVGNSSQDYPSSLYYSGTSATGSVDVAGNYYLSGSGSQQSITVEGAGSASVLGGVFQLSGNNNDVDVNSSGSTTLAGFGNTVNMNYTGGSLHLIDQGGDINTMNLTASTGLTFDIQDPSSLATTDGYQVNGNSYQFNFTDGSFQTVNFLPSTGQTLSIQDDQDNNDWIVTVVCFVAGTRIRTTRGEVAVEDLTIGDLAVTTSGEARPIIWLGHKRIARPGREHWPVRVLADAFGDNLPERDLFLSPGHAVCVDVMGEVLVPISELVNGASVAQVEVADVAYWHVELASHDVLLAEGLPAESYMDAGNRAFFGREYGRLAVVDPARRAASLTRYARPFVDRGPLVGAVRERLSARAETLGRAGATAAA